MLPMICLAPCSCTAFAVEREHRQRQLAVGGQELAR